MKFSIKHTYQRNSGFTLIELVLTLSIISIVLVSMFGILRFSTVSCNIGDNIDELLLHGRYAVEYIKDDIKSADKIISSNTIRNLNLKFPDNIGFIIVKIDDMKTPAEYSYITYHRKNNSLIRLGCNRLDNKYPSYTEFSGNNELSEFLYDISKTKYDMENKMISLEFIFKHMKGNELKLKSDIYIRSSLD